MYLLIHTVLLIIIMINFIYRMNKIKDRLMDLELKDVIKELEDERNKI